MKSPLSRCNFQEVVDIAEAEVLFGSGSPQNGNCP